MRHSARDFDFLRLEKFIKREKRGLVFCGKLIAILSPNKVKIHGKCQKKSRKIEISRGIRNKLGADSLLI